MKRFLAIITLLLVAAAALADTSAIKFQGVLPVANGGSGSATPTYHYDVSWKSPVVADDVYAKVGNGAITLTSLDCVATGSTTPSAFVVTIGECDSNATNCVNSTGTVSLSALVTNGNDTSFTDAAITDDEWVKFDVTSLTTAPDYAHCRLEYTQP